MILYTPMPLEAVMASEKDDLLVYQEIQYGGITFVVEPASNGRGKIVQIRSTDPNVYLRQEFQPGKEIPLWI